MVFGLRNIDGGQLQELNQDLVPEVPEPRRRAFVWIDAAQRFPLVIWCVRSRR